MIGRVRNIYLERLKRNKRYHTEHHIARTDFEQPAHRATVQDGKIRIGRLASCRILLNRLGMKSISKMPRL